jgi:hypothetical protein
MMSKLCDCIRFYVATATSSSSTGTRSATQNQQNDDDGNNNNNNNNNNNVDINTQSDIYSDTQTDKDTNTNIFTDDTNPTAVSHSHYRTIPLPPHMIALQALSSIDSASCILLGIWQSPQAYSDFYTSSVYQDVFADVVYIAAEGTYSDIVEKCSSKRLFQIHNIFNNNNN